MRQKRRSFLPAFVLAIISWGGWLYIFLCVPPTSFSTLVSFHLLLFLALSLTLSLLLASSRWGFLISAGLTSYLVLRFLKMAYLLHVVLLLSLFLTLGFYLRKG